MAPTGATPGSISRSSEAAATRSASLLVTSAALRDCGSYVGSAVITTTCPLACSTATCRTPSWVATSADAVSADVTVFAVAGWQSQSARDAPQSHSTWSQPLATVSWRPDRERPSSQR